MGYFDDEDLFVFVDSKSPSRCLGIFVLFFVFGDRQHPYSLGGFFSFSLSTCQRSRLIFLFFKICLNISTTRHPFVLCLHTRRRRRRRHTYKEKRNRRARERESVKRREEEIENFAFFKFSFFFAVCANATRQEEHTQVTELNDPKLNR